MRIEAQHLALTISRRTTLLRWLEGHEAVLLGIDFDDQVLVLDLGRAGVNLQADRPLAQASGILVGVARDLHAVDRHPDGARLEVRQDFGLMPDMWIEVGME